MIQLNAVRRLAMPNRPAIPAPTARQIVIESGHRCAVCGAECPLERAHIVPWRKTRDHSADNLICLCANCHQRADLEGWGEKTLRSYKEHPWVHRQRFIARPAEATQTVEITITKDIQSFDDHAADMMRYALAGFLKVNPSSISIVSKREGSTIVTVSMPRSSAETLIEAFGQGDDELRNALILFPTAAIEPVGEHRSESDAGHESVSVLQELFLEHLDIIESTTRTMARRLGFDDADAQDLESTVKLKIIDDDYAVLRKFRGQASLRNYLTVVISNLMRDFRAAQRGKYRPSAVARRSGQTAVALDALLRRDGLTVDEAIQVLRTNFQVSESPEDLRNLAAQLPMRARRQFIGEEAVADLVSESRSDQAVLSTERLSRAGRIEAKLGAAVAHLDAESRLLLELKFQHGRTLADIADHLDLSPRQVYHKFNRLLSSLRRELDRTGVHFGDVVEVLGWWEETGVLPDRLPWALFHDQDPPSQLVAEVQAMTAELATQLDRPASSVGKRHRAVAEQGIADLLTDHGWRVDLTTSTRDRRYDLVGISKEASDTGSSWLLELNRQGQRARIGLDVVTALYGVRNVGSPAGLPMVATTSHLRENVLALKESEYDLELTAFEAVLDWTNTFRPNPAGRVFVKDQKLVVPGDGGWMTSPA